MSLTGLRYGFGKCIFVTCSVPYMLFFARHHLDNLYLPTYTLKPTSPHEGGGGGTSSGIAGNGGDTSNPTSGQGANGGGGGGGSPALPATTPGSGGE